MSYPPFVCCSMLQLPQHPAPLESAAASEDILRLKTEMRQVLQGASDSGAMKTVLEEWLGLGRGWVATVVWRFWDDHGSMVLNMFHATSDDDPLIWMMMMMIDGGDGDDDGFPSRRLLPCSLPRISGEQKTQKVQGELRDALFEANESGKMKQILDETLGICLGLDLITQDPESWFIAEAWVPTEKRTWKGLAASKFRSPSHSGYWVWRLGAGLLVNFTCIFALLNSLQDHFHIFTSKTQKWPTYPQPPIPIPSPTPSST